MRQAKRPHVQRDGHPSPLRPSASQTNDACLAPSRGDYSERTSEVIDAEVRKLLLAAEDRVRETLTQRQSQLEALAQSLLAQRGRGSAEPGKVAPRPSAAEKDRPAGALFTVAGQIYRPAQDCSRTYGGAIVINKIERLTPEKFVELPY